MSTTVKKSSLIGNCVTLRPMLITDADAMYASLLDEESMRLTGTQDTFTRAQVESYCRRIVDADDRLDFAITLTDSADYIGEAVLNEIDWRNRSANFRIALANQSLCGQGYGTEASRLVIAYGLQTLQLHRIELEVYDFNSRARHVYEKLGFVQEGIRRDVLLWDGAYHDAIVMSILAGEYK